VAGNSKLLTYDILKTEYSTCCCHFSIFFSLQNGRFIWHKWLNTIEKLHCIVSSWINEEEKHKLTNMRRCCYCTLIRARPKEEACRMQLSLIYWSFLQATNTRIASKRELKKNLWIISSRVEGMNSIPSTECIYVVLKWSIRNHFIFFSLEASFLPSGWLPMN
jgi:hypothetical protein